MPEETSKVTALVNIGQMKVAEKVYDDAMSPGLRKVGQALATVMDIGNTALWPVRWANERARLFFENNLNKYKEHLEKIPEEHITEVPTELSIPILQRFRYVTTEELSNAFVRLLANASSTATIPLAHNGFIAVLDRLSPDEARILEYFNKHAAIAKWSFGWWNTNHEQFDSVLHDETLINEFATLIFPKNKNIYFENLVSLGVLEKVSTYWVEIEPQFQRLAEVHNQVISETKPRHVFEGMENRYRRECREMYNLTAYGRLFVDACIKE